MFLSPFARRLSIVAGTVLTAALLVTGSGVVHSPPAAVAAESPPLPQTVSADVLPTPQINGVVWNVAVVGSVAYAVGSFTSARPFGAAAGTQEVGRNNAMAFNVTTGAILPWNPGLSAQGRTVKASPDGTQLYVGGDFNTVSGRAQSKIAAFSLPSGALVTTFRPSANGAVVGIAVSNTTVYAGGSFASAGGQSRANLAAFGRATGALTAWKPTAEDIVQALVVAPDSSRVIIGGRFQNLNGAGIVGIGAVDGVTGATLPWTSRPIPTRQGSSRSWVTDLVVDNGVVYGTANGEGGHWFDGRFSASFAKGDLIWLDNCYGASYGTAVIGSVAYSVSHAHDCTSLNTFPEQRPSVWKRALANTTYATGIDQANPGSNMNYTHQPIPTQLGWYPAVNAGSYTGIYQGGWSLGANSDYLVMGGEFTSVNGKAQQGLATFANRAIAPNKIGPIYSTALKPSVISPSAGTVRVAFTATADYDDAVLTYQLLRDNSTTPISSADVASPWWALPQTGFVDRGLAAGSTHTYRIQVTDPWGNSYIGPRSAPVTVSSAVPSAYTELIADDGASAYWPLNEPSGTVVYDNVGFADADAGTDVTRGVDGVFANDAAASFPGSTTGTASTRTAQPGPNTFTIEAWFKTESTGGGKIIGYGSSPTGNSTSYDRHVYLDGSGQVTFGVYPGAVQTVTSTPGFNDGEWHLVTASLGADGMKLYLDGTQAASRSDVTSAQAYGGFWRIGGDTLGGWPGSGSSSYLAGTIDNVAIYPTVLAGSAVLQHYQAGTGTVVTPNAPPAAAFTSTNSELVASMDGTGSSDPDGSITDYSWTFGDGGTGTGSTASHTYGADGVYTVSLTVTDNSGATGTTSHPVTVATSPPPAPITAYAQDAFERSVPTGFGSADIGGAWSSSSSASNFSVAAGVGRIRMLNAGSGPSIYLNSVASSDTEVTVGIGLDKTPTGGGITTSVIGRSVAGQGDYRAKVVYLANGSVALGLARTSATGAQTAVSPDVVVPGLTYAVGDILNVRVQVVGTSPTTLNARVWKNGTPEPTVWQRAATDSTAGLQTPGRIGFFSYLSGSSVNAPVVSLWDNLLAGKPGN